MNGNFNPQQLPVVVRKTADETLNNDNTPQNDNELYLALGANEVWQFRLMVIGNSSTGPDFATQIDVPSGATVYWGKSSDAQKARVGGTKYKDDGEANIRLYVWDGIVIMGSTAGNLQYVWSQYSLQASNTTVYANSCLVCYRLK